MPPETAAPVAADEYPAEQSCSTAEADADAERRRELDEVIAARRKMRFGGAR
jgi:hypothetical protein